MTRRVVGRPSICPPQDGPCLVEGGHHRGIAAEVRVMPPGTFTVGSLDRGAARIRSDTEDGVEVVHQAQFESQVRARTLPGGHVPH